MDNYINLKRFASKFKIGLISFYRGKIPSSFFAWNKIGFQNFALKFKLSYSMIKYNLSCFITTDFKW